MRRLRAAGCERWDPTVSRTEGCVVVRLISEHAQHRGMQLHVHLSSAHTDASEPLQPVISAWGLPVATPQWLSEDAKGLIKGPAQLIALLRQLGSSSRCCCLEHSQHGAALQRMQQRGELRPTDCQRICLPGGLGLDVHAVDLWRSSRCSVVVEPTAARQQCCAECSGLASRIA